MNRLIVLTGPSCVGKSPLLQALRRFYPALADTLRTLVLYNSRPPRPNESDGVDYHFRSRGHIEGLRDDPSFSVIQARADLQALSFVDLDEAVHSGLDPFFEGNPFVAMEIIRAAGERSLPVLDVFMSPLSLREILDLKDRLGSRKLIEFVTRLMKRKLLRRTRRQRTHLTDDVLRDLDVRARSACHELAMTHAFQHVLPNHDGEDSPNWSMITLSGDAQRSLDAFVSLLQGALPAPLEKWSQNLFDDLI